MIVDRDEFVRIVRERVEAFGLTNRDLARAIGVNETFVCLYLKGKRESRYMPGRLGEVLGLGADDVALGMPELECRVCGGTDSIIEYRGEPPVCEPCDNRTDPPNTWLGRRRKWELIGRENNAI